MLLKDDTDVQEGADEIEDDFEDDDTFIELYKNAGKVPLVEEPVAEGIEKSCYGRRSYS